MQIGRELGLSAAEMECAKGRKQFDCLLAAWRGLKSFGAVPYVHLPSAMTV